MTYKNGWTVIPQDVRPARPDGTCFYCSKPLGSEHQEGCVIRTKTVVVDVTFRIVREVPEDWEPSMIEFHMNESSSCADNLFADIDAVADRDDGCLCGQTEAKFIRDATAEDEEQLRFTPRREPRQ